MDLIGSELCKTFQFCEVRTPPGGLAPAGAFPSLRSFPAPPKNSGCAATKGFALVRLKAPPLPKNASPFPALGRGEI